MPLFQGITSHAKAASTHPSHPDELLDNQRAVARVRQHNFVLPSAVCDQLTLLHSDRRTLFFTSISVDVHSHCVGVYRWEILWLLARLTVQEDKSVYAAGPLFRTNFVSIKTMVHTHVDGDTKIISPWRRAPKSVPRTVKGCRNQTLKVHSENDRQIDR